MRSTLRLGLLLAAVAGGLLHAQTAAPRPSTGTGTIVGHVRMTGPSAGNPIIRMGVDPVCAGAARSKRIVQEYVVRTPDGSLANAVVSLQGTFPKSQAPAQRITVNQQDCQYAPRVVAGQVGQTLMVINRDMTLHNTQSVTTKGNAFNTTQPSAGMVFSYVLKAAEIIRLKCEPHQWMIGFVAIFDHPYFAVTSTDGAFTISKVPAGRQTVRVWHEVFGEVTRQVVVKAGDTVTLDIAYAGAAKKSATGVRDVIVPPMPLGHNHALTE